jgi:hypothetical protein
MHQDCIPSHEEMDRIEVQWARAIIERDQQLEAIKAAQMRDPVFWVGVALLGACLGAGFSIAIYGAAALVTGAS